MVLEAAPVVLCLKRPFTLSRGTSEWRTVIIVRLRRGDFTGYGEAAPIPRYGESAESVLRFVKLLRTECLEVGDDVSALHEYLDSVSREDRAAKAAIDIAYHDLLGKQKGKPLWKLWGLGSTMPPSSMTIGIDSAGVIEAKVDEAQDFPVLKVKLGSTNDRDIIHAVRRRTNKPLRIDANEGWQTKAEALEMIRWLAAQGVELIEQPMPARCVEEMVWLRKRVEIPLVADESMTSGVRPSSLSGAFDGVNIKLMKCGGLEPARKLIAECRNNGLKVMMGCMVESSIGISAAAQLGPLVDYIDLDGNELVSNDPFAGVDRRAGTIILSERHGIGCYPL
jgi:L-alanine-DL-glutamate epimerase-like enolase superfamily enzyme